MEKINWNKEWKTQGNWNRECSSKIFNFTSGCSNNCLYCYARAMFSKWKKIDPNDWKNEKIRIRDVKKKHKKYNSIVMSPSSHDITPYNINEYKIVLKDMLDAGNKVLVVSKPRFDCVKSICDDFQDYKSNILMRFTIGSTNNDVLKFWEPGAPLFEERLESLKYAYENGYQTSVSSEPLLDKNTDDLLNKLEPFITESIWFGRITKLLSNLKFNGYEHNTEVQEKALNLLEWQKNDFFWIDLYNKYKDNKKVNWKGKLKETLGII